MGPLCAARPTRPASLRPARSRACSQQISELQQLRSLQLEGNGARMSDSVHVISCLTGLQALTVRRLGNLPRQLVLALRRLQRLTSLQLITLRGDGAKG